jgi:predicted HTH transcriptional regulator
VPTDREAVLFIGVMNNSEPQNLKNPDLVQMRIQKVCTEQCYPPIKFTSEVLIVDDKKILAVIVGHSNDKPHFSGDKPVR